MPSLEEVLQAEAEVLATELQSLEDDGAGVEAAAESLVTMREARSCISEMRKDRGFGKVGQGKGAAAKVKPASTKKSSTTCWDCGEYGHWSGDGQCKKLGAGLYKPKGKGTSSSSKWVAQHRA